MKVIREWMEKNLYKETGNPFTEIDIKFDTYQKYLADISVFIKTKYGNSKKIAETIWNNTATINTVGRLDSKMLRRFLFLGWNTEILARANDDKDLEFLRINNQWKPIQSYYAVYSIGEALCYVIDGNHAGSHSKCLEKINSFVVNTAKIEPWCFAYSGSERKGILPVNFPSGTKPVSNLKQSGYQPIEMIMKCIKAEHGNIIEEYRPRKSNGKRLLKKDHDPGFTTILDFLYRLRIKSNYKDVEIFIHEALPELTKGFSDNLTKMVFYTLFLFEILIIRKYGLDNFLKLADEFSTANGAAKELARRVGFYRGKLLE